MIINPNEPDFEIKVATAIINQDTITFSQPKLLITPKETKILNLNFLQNIRTPKGLYIKIEKTQEQNEILQRIKTECIKLEFKDKKNFLIIIISEILKNKYKEITGTASRLAEFIGLDKNIEIIDLHGKKNELFPKELEKITIEPDEILITGTFTYNYKIINEYIKIIRRKFKQSKISVGGTLVTLAPNSLRQFQIDRVMTGKLCINEFSFPNLNIIKKFYSDYDTLICYSSHGCPNNCTYCGFSVLEGNKLRFNSPEKILNDIKETKKIFPKIKDIFFMDENICLNYKNHLKKIILETKKQNIDIKYSLLFDIKKLNEETIEDLEGITKDLRISFEDINLENIKKYNKSEYNFTESRRMFKKLLEKQTKPIIEVILGTPHQTKEDMILSILFSIAMGSRLEIHPFVPVPRTQDFKTLKPIIKAKKIDYADLAPGKYQYYDSKKERYIQNLIDIFKSDTEEETTIKSLGTIFNKKSKNKEQEIIIQEIKEIFSKNYSFFWDTYTIKNEESLFWNINNEKILNTNISEDKKTIIDMGCSTGEFTKKIANENKKSKIIGIDFSSEALKIATEKNKLDNIDYINQNIENTIFIEKSDLIFDRGLLHCIKNPTKYFEFLNNNLKEKGTIRIFHLCNTKYNSLLNTIANEMLYTLREPDEIIKLFESNNFMLNYKKINKNKTIEESAIFEFIKINNKPNKNKLLDYLKYAKLKQISNTNEEKPKIIYFKNEIKTQISINKKIIEPLFRT